jgi:hypothetical protein
MRSTPSRRRFLLDVAAGFSAAALPDLVRAQSATQPPTKQAAKPSPYSINDPVAIEVKARPLPSFDIRDRSRVRFGALEYRSGLILTSPFSGFGGLSALRLDPKGERFISLSDK